MIYAAHGTRRTARAESACELSAKLIVATISDLSDNNITIHNTPSTSGGSRNSVREGPERGIEI